jgi:hypothetical protein
MQDTSPRPPETLNSHDAERAAHTFATPESVFADFAVKSRRLFRKKWIPALRSEYAPDIFWRIT